MILASDELMSLNCVSALNDHNIQGASIDLSLNDTAKIIEDKVTELDIFNVDLNKELDIYKTIDLAKGFWLQPQCYLYGSSVEKVNIPTNMCGILLPRSTFARLGLILPISSYANPGYTGNLPIVIFNASPIPIRIPPYIRIMQLLLCEIKGNAKSYNTQQDAKYQNENLKNPHLNDIELKEILERLKR